MGEKPLLAPKPASITGQIAIGTDDAVARDADSDRIGTVREADRAAGRSSTDLPCQRAIAGRRASRNILQRPPHLSLKIRASEFDGQRMQSVSIARKISFDRARNGARRGGRRN